MIEEIGISNLGVIDQAALPLGPGFTAITGETGAGKTMVVTALGLLLGGRSDSGAIRKGAAQAAVDGRWIVPADGDVAERVREAGGSLDTFGDNQAELTLGRSVSAEGRSRASVGGRSAPVGVLTELGEQLVVVHGQSDQIRLRSATAQREALDRFAGEALTMALADYRDLYQRWQSAVSEHELLVAEHDRRSAEADELRIAIDEIDGIAPAPGEDDELTSRAERLGNLEELRQAANGAREALSAEESDTADVLALLDGARRQLERVAAHDQALGTLAEQIANTSYAVSEFALELSSYLAELDTDGARELEIVQERRALLGTLIRKYGPSLGDVIDYRATGTTRLLELDGDTDRIEELERLIAADAERVYALADTLSATRERAASALALAVSDELSALAMPDAQIMIEVTRSDELGFHGRDLIAFLLQPHAGAEPRALGKGASGGELSRVMLAIEVVIAGTDPVPTFVFDEVDAGVGGAAAIEIGRRLAKLAENAQVIAVTHLAQVAAFANNHLAVVKDRDGSVTASSVTQLSGDARVAEMARLLSGLADSDSGLAHAEELLMLARSRSKVIG